MSQKSVAANAKVAIEWKLFMQHLFTYIDPIPDKHLEQVCRVLAQGGIVSYPTDVNWAVGCDATNVKSVTRLRQLKAPHPQPFTLMCADISMVSRIANVDDQAFKFLRKLTPGPYTLILKSNRTLAKQINDRRLNVGVRIPKFALLQAIVQRFGKPLATTTCGKDNEELRFGYEVQEKYGHMLDLLIDLGTEVEPRMTSIVDFSMNIPIVIRKGAGDVSMFS